MKKSIFLFLAFCFCGIVFAAEPNEPNDSNDINRLLILELQKTIENKNNLIQKLRADAIQLKKDLIYTKKENELLRKVCTALGVNIPANLNNKIVENLQKAEPIIKPYFSTPLFVGQIAKLGSSQTMKIVQIIDGNNMIAELKFIWSYDNPPSYSSSQEITVWVKGINTQNLADEQKVETGEQAFKITGTKTYDTAIGGTKTVFILEPVELF